MRRKCSVKVLPNESVGGAGRVSIHLFVQDKGGPIVEPHALHPVIKNGVAVKQMCEARPTRGRLACDPGRTVAPITRGGVTTITPRTDDPRAVTCPKCIMSIDHMDAMARLEEPTPNQAAPGESPDTIDTDRY